MPTSQTVVLGARRRGGDNLIKLARHLRRLGHVPVVDSDTATYVEARRLRAARIAVRARRERPAPALAVALGGDGSFIQLAARYAPLGVPVTGVNLGRVGFLADVDAAQMGPVIAGMLAGEHEDEKRLMLAVRHVSGKQVRTEPVINDVVIDRGPARTVIELEVAVSGYGQVRLRGDGAVFATPGGSTAYNLAAGGPVVSPQASCLVLTPLNPFPPNYCPLVFAHKHEFTVTTNGPARLVCDGRREITMLDGDEVHISTHRRALVVRHPPGYDYLRTLSTKLDWGYG